MNDLKKLFADPRLLRGPGPWVVGLLVAVNLALVAGKRQLDAAFEDPTVGVLRDARQGEPEFDPTVPPERAGNLVRYDRSLSQRLGLYWRYIPDARRQPLVIVAGMSQMYTINNFRPGDQTVAEHMDDALAPRGVRVFGLAAPNLSHEEGLFLLASTATDPRTKPKAFVFAVCFDKFRQADLRGNYQSFLRERPELRAYWRATAERYAQKYPLASAAMRKSLEGLDAQAAVVDNSFEARLRRGAGRVSPLVAARTDLNTKVRLALFEARNRALGIRTSSKRPLMPSLYAMNQEFLGLMADVAKENGVELMMYVVPLNMQAETPYVDAEYAAFKAWFDGFTRERGIPAANLEQVVPREAWGTFLGGPDFKHFRGEGHRRTAQALVARFGPLLTGRPAPALAQR
jgi:hypothetical protein